MLDVEEGSKERNRNCIVPYNSLQYHFALALICVCVHAQICNYKRPARSKKLRQSNE